MFSVIIPYYNKAAYIERCIESVLNQTFGEFEIIIIDDGSTDGGTDLIAKMHNPRIHIYHQKNQGVSAARNAGIKHAAFEYIALLDADDCWHPQYLENMHWIICHEKDVRIIGAHYSRTNDFLEREYYTLPYFKFDDYFKEAIRNTYFTSSSTVIEKRFFKENDGFNPKLKKGEDLDVWFRAVQNGGNAFYINHTLVHYSEEDANQVTRNKVGLENDLVGVINNRYSQLRLSNTQKSFNKLISLYVYFNLYPYYFDTKNHVKAKQILKENEHDFPLLKLVYLMPFALGKKIVESKRGITYLRMYLKFATRYIYN